MSTKTERIPVVVIFAPTASGKTALMRELFSQNGSHFILTGEVVSADSQQVYKHMDIGTAKPSPEFCKEIPHHLIDMLLPSQQWNIFDFVEAADRACEEIAGRGKIPVVCGGSGFYVRSFLYGPPPTPESDSKVREELKNRIAAEGNEALYNELKMLDPQSAQRIHVNDAYRICRALEVYRLSGKPRSSYTTSLALRDKYNFVLVVLEPPREALYERIRVRVDQMFRDGLEDEVRSLVDLGYGAQSPGMKAIGYSEWFDDEKPGQLRDAGTVRDEIKKHSCKYAKKQFTYIRDIPLGIRLDYRALDDDVRKVSEVIKSNLNAFRE